MREQLKVNIESQGSSKTEFKLPSDKLKNVNDFIDANL